MDFYKTLEEIMREKNMSIPEVARACGLSDGTVRSIVVRKSQNVSLEVAFKLSAGLGVSLERLNGDAPRNEKIAPPELSDEAKKIARDYEGLDRHGRRITRMVIDEEQKRMAEERPMIQAAARGGGVLQIEEVRPDELPGSELIP